MAEPAQVEVAGNPEHGLKESEAVADDSSSKDILEALLRALAVAATLAAAIVMGTNKHTKSIPVAMVNNVPVIRPITAKFSYTPAFVYFVVANAIAGGYAALTLFISLVIKPRRSDFFQFILCTQDLVTAVLLATGAAAATAVAEVGRHGNSHSRWHKICDKFGGFCNQGGGAILASFIGVGILVALNVHSTYTLYKRTVRH